MSLLFAAILLTGAGPSALMGARSRSLPLLNTTGPTPLRGGLLVPCATLHTLPPPLVRGQRALLCLELEGRIALLNPVIDSLLMLTIPYSLAAPAPAPTTFSISAGGASTSGTRRLYVPPAPAALALPQHTLIITSVGGLITSAAWQDACEGCSGMAACVPASLPSAGGAATGGACSVPTAACSATESATTCDLTIFVAWTGTDAKWAALTSASRVPSAFVQFALSAAAFWEGLRGASLLRA